MVNLCVLLYIDLKGTLGNSLQPLVALLYILLNHSIKNHICTWKTILWHNLISILRAFKVSRLTVVSHEAKRITKNKTHNILLCVFYTSERFHNMMS